jgi:hypothetical protein
MKQFIATYESERNIFKGELCIDAEFHEEAMGKFFEWLKKQPVWSHLWRVNISLREVERLEKI